jgi:5'(3')-deoxyribonucleotidase
MTKKIIYIDMDGVLVDLGYQIINSLKNILISKKGTKNVLTTYKVFLETHLLLKELLRR